MKKFKIIAAFILLICLFSGCADKVDIDKANVLPTQGGNSPTVSQTSSIPEVTLPSATQGASDTPAATPETPVATIAPTATVTSTPKATPKATPKPTPAEVFGIRPRPKSPEKLSTALEQKIKQEYVELYKSTHVATYPVVADATIDNITVFEYLGTYNGNVALRISCNVAGVPLPPPSDTGAAYDGYYFGSDTGAYITVYKDGKFVYLYQAYNEKRFSTMDIRDLYWYFYESLNQPLSALNPAKLSTKQEQEIKKAFLKFKKYTSQTEKDIVIDKYLGTYNGCVALMLHSKKVSPTGGTVTLTVSGIEFTFANSSSVIYICKDGAFFDLETACYGENIPIYDTDLRNIFWYYTCNE